MYTPEQLQEKISSKLKELPLYGEPAGLYQPIVYSLEQGGKRIRPMFVLLSNQMFGGNPEEALPAATAIEIFHNFTLLHDDIIDQAPLRRGNKTVYQKWNTNIAILSGDTMFAIAYGELSKSNPVLLPNLMDIFTRTAIEVCEGQQFDIEFEETNNVTLENYINMIRLKTAVLLAASLKIGAIIAGASAIDADKIYDFGINLGIAFQLQDDLLDAFGDQSVFGKQTGGDIAANKKTALFLKAIEMADSDTRMQLEQYYTAGDVATEKKVTQVLSIFEKLEIKSAVEEIISEYYNRGMSIFNSISVTEQQSSMLRDLTTLMLRRNR